MNKRITNETNLNQLCIYVLGISNIYNTSYQMYLLSSPLQLLQYPRTISLSLQYIPIFNPLSSHLEQ